MSSGVLMRGFCVLLLSAVFAYTVSTRFDSETGSELYNTEKQKYIPIINGSLLPCYVILLLIASFIVIGSKYVLEVILPMIWGIFIHISIYYFLLLFAMPYLRKIISSRTCALLWMLPNYLYLMTQPSFEISDPVFIIHLPEQVLLILFIVWLAGFILILLRAIIQHFRYRQKILQHSIPVTDPDILEVWQRELDLARVQKPKYRVVISKEVSAPLSIGFLNRTTRVVLPDHHYSAEELALIFRHEIIHICRGDSVNKFFLVFCSAMCWFNPLMWIAMRRSADDLELSCDETVLLKADEMEKRRYANLILNVVGDQRGFTTHLSSSASAMRYRLKSIMRSGSRKSGAIIVGVIFFILSMTCGYITVSYKEYTANEQFFDRYGEVYTINGFNTSIIEHNGFLECRDEDALNAYLGGLSLSRIGGNYAFDTYENDLLLIYDTDSDSFAFHIKDQILTITKLGVASYEENYQIRTRVDWDYLESLLSTDYIQDVDATFPPRLNIIELHDPSWHISGIVRNYSKNGQPQPEKSWWFGNDSRVFTNPPDKELRLFFTHKISGVYTVEITDIQGNAIDNITSDQLLNPEILPILSENANYKILATFEDAVSKIDMEYNFTVMYTDSNN